MAKIIQEYSNQHRSNVTREISYPISRAEKGMIYRVKYNKKNGDSEMMYILVLNPRYKAKGESEYKLHCIKLNHFPEKALNKLADKYGIVFAPNLQRWRMLDVTKLVEQISSKRFYDREVEKLMRQHPSYRTLFLTEFADAKLIDYQFDKTIEARWLSLNENIEEDTDNRHNI